MNEPVRPRWSFTLTTVFPSVLHTQGCRRRSRQHVLGQAPLALSVIFAVTVNDLSSGPLLDSPIHSVRSCLHPIPRHTGVNLAQPHLVAVLWFCLAIAPFLSSLLVVLRLPFVKTKACVGRGPHHASASRPNLDPDHCHLFSRSPSSWGGILVVCISQEFPISDESPSPSFRHFKFIHSQIAFFPCRDSNTKGSNGLA